MPADPKDTIYPLNTSDEISKPERIVRRVAVFSVVALFITFLIVLNSWGSSETTFLHITIGVWAVAPPIWFWYEYFYIYRKYAKPGTLEVFKHGQDVSKAIWAGVLAGLLALAASDIVDFSKDCESESPNKALNGTAQSAAP